MPSRFYTVQRGDTAGRIARTHGVRLSDLILANNLSTRATIYPRQTLRIPLPGERVTPPQPQPPVIVQPEPPVLVAALDQAKTEPPPVPDHNPSGNQTPVAEPAAPEPRRLPVASAPETAPEMRLETAVTAPPASEGEKELPMPSVSAPEGSGESQVVQTPAPEVNQTPQTTPAPEPEAKQAPPASPVSTSEVAQVPEAVAVPVPGDNQEPQVAPTTPPEEKQAPLVAAASEPEEKQALPMAASPVPEALPEPQVSPAPVIPNPEIVSIDVRFDRVTKIDQRTVGIIQVEVEETLGHYAEWAGIRAQQIRRLNGLSFGRTLGLHQKIKIPLDKTTAAAFEEQRYEYHKRLQEDFFAVYRVSELEPYRVASGDNYWVLCREKFEVPMWLLKHYNLDVDLAALRINQKLMIPVIEKTDAGDPGTVTDDEAPETAATD
jgi:LysM repeat protein